MLETVRKNHTDVDRLAYERLVKHALEGMLASLDPHSSFIHPEMARQLDAQRDLSPELGSRGMSLGLRDGGFFVAAVSPMGPAVVLGILPGSSLLEIDGRKTEGAVFSELLDSLRRRAGETSRLVLKSPAAPKPIEVSLTHRMVEDRSVVEARIWDQAGG